MFLSLFVAFVLTVQSLTRRGAGWTWWWGFLDARSLPEVLRADVLVLWLGVSAGAFICAAPARKSWVGICGLLILVAYLAAEGHFGGGRDQSEWAFVAMASFGAAAWLLASRRNPWTALAAIIAAPLASAGWAEMKSPDLMMAMFGATVDPMDYMALHGMIVWVTAFSAIIAVRVGVLVDKRLPVGESAKA